MTQTLGISTARGAIPALPNHTKVEALLNE